MVKPSARRIKPLGKGNKSENRKAECGNKGGAKAEIVLFVGVLLTGYARQFSCAFLTTSLCNLSFVNIKSFAANNADSIFAVSFVMVLIGALARTIKRSITYGLKFFSAINASRSFSDSIFIHFGGATTDTTKILLRKIFQKIFTAMFALADNAS